jgi:hypothetical protein
MGGFLEIKLVNPTKIVSRTSKERCFGQFLLSQTEADIWAASTRVLRESDAAVWQELG